MDKPSMPMIRVDEVRHSVSSVENKSVQVRFNGALTTVADLLSLDPKLIRNVEFINNPGVRYGGDIGYVINIRTRRADEGVRYRHRPYQCREQLAWIGYGIRPMEL